MTAEYVNPLWTERDSESGLDYATFRYDSSRLGRFMTPDPIAGSIGDPQSLNRYAYTRNDPVNLVDPLGLLCSLNTGVIFVFGISNEGRFAYATPTLSFECGFLGGFFALGGTREPRPQDEVTERPVTREFEGTFECGATAEDVLQDVRGNFPDYANFAGTFGPFDAAYASASFGDTPVERGNNIAIENTVLYPGLTGVGSLQINTSVDVLWSSNSSFTLQTTPGHPEHPGRITFASTQVGGDSVRFSIQIDAVITGPRNNFLYLIGGHNLQTEIWDNFINKVRSFCEAH